jgi:predicted nucleic acid-binding protein
MAVFVDTGAWAALLTRSDRNHESAARIEARLAQEKARLLTSEYVIDETVTWLRYKVGHGAAVEFWETTRKSKLVETAPVDAPVVTTAWEIFRKYSDHKFSFTDCRSFALMRARRVNRVFAFDGHFAVMGFRLES